MRAENLKKTFGARVVLDLPDIELERGKIYAVVGANGSGKSTLARLLSGVYAADENKRVLLAKVAVGYMPQKSFAFNMSLYKNVSINGNPIGAVFSADELLEKLEIANLSKTNAKNLSGGETAKMALARLLVKRFDLLVADEPTAAMDVSSTLAAEELIKEYVLKTNCAVLLVTHSLSQAARLADEALFISNGKLVERGAPTELFTSPKCEETKKFTEFYGTFNR